MRPWKLKRRDSGESGVEIPETQEMGPWFEEMGPWFEEMNPWRLEDTTLEHLETKTWCLRKQDS